MTRKTLSDEAIQQALAEAAAIEQARGGTGEEEYLEYRPVKKLRPVRASEVSIAHYLLKSLQQTGPIISTRGGIWQYDSSDGIWFPYTQDELKAMVDQLDGLRCGKTQIVVTDQKATGAYKALLRHPKIQEPFFFDDTPNGIQCTNGFVQVTKEEITLTKNAPEYRATSTLDFEYDVEAQGYGWSTFLHKLFAKDKDKNAKARLLQEFFGACMTGKAPDYARVLVLLGEGANGKSTLTDLMEELFPTANVTSVVPQSWGKEYYLARLQTSRLNVCTEIPEQAVVASDTFKSVVTGEPVTARVPYGKPFDFVPRAGHIFSANTLPAVRDYSKGFWRRFLIITFNEDFSRTKRTKEDVLVKLRPLLPDVLTWTLKGAQRLLRDGSYTIPSSTAVALQAWRTEADSVAFWLEECRAKEDKKGTPAGALWCAYQHWAEAMGYAQISVSTFSKRLKLLGYRKEKRNDRNYYLVKIL